MASVALHNRELRHSDTQVEKEGGFPCVKKETMDLLQISGLGRAIQIIIGFSWSSHKL